MTVDEPRNSTLNDEDLIRQQFEQNSMLVIQELNMKNTRVTQEFPQEISEVNSSPYKVGNYIYPINESIPFTDFPDHEQDHL